MSKPHSVEIGDVVFQGEFEELSLIARVSQVENDEFWATLELKGSPAAEGWQADSVNDNFDVFAFGIWMDGPGLPVWWGDLDLDGKPELLAPLPKGDLSPTVFRIFRWTGEDLLFLKKRVLIEDAKGHFQWTPPGDEAEEATWVETFVQGRAEVFSSKGGKLSRELLDLAPSKTGFQQVS